jgi:hypothetical protein
MLTAGGGNTVWPEDVHRSVLVQSAPNILQLCIAQQGSVAALTLVYQTCAPVTKVLLAPTKQ